MTMIPDASAITGKIAGKHLSQAKHWSCMHRHYTHGCTEQKEDEIAGLALLQRRYGWGGVTYEDGVRSIVTVSAEAAKPVEQQRIPVSLNTIMPGWQWLNTNPDTGCRIPPNSSLPMILTANLRFSIPHSIVGLLLPLFVAWYSESKAQTANKRNLERVMTIPTDDPFPESSFLTTKKGQGEFALVENGIPCSIVVSESDYPGVVKVADLFRKDLSYVSGKEAQLVIGDWPKSGDLVIVGTVGKSTLIDQLVKQGKIDVSGLRGKWEQFLIIPVRHPR